MEVQGGEDGGPETQTGIEERNPRKTGERKREGKNDIHTEISKTETELKRQQKIRMTSNQQLEKEERDREMAFNIWPEKDKPGWQSRSNSLCLTTASGWPLGYLPTPPNQLPPSPCVSVYLCGVGA